MVKLQWITHMKKTTLHQRDYKAGLNLHKMECFLIGSS